MKNKTYHRYAIIEFRNCGPSITKFTSKFELTDAEWVEKIHQNLIDVDDFNEDRDSFTVIDSISTTRLK